LPDAAGPGRLGFRRRVSLTEPLRRGVELTVSLEPASSSVLARIAESIGGVPHVL
jgi:hypothetical protein